MEQTHQHLRVKLYKNPSALHEFSASEKSVVAINFSLVTTMAINGTSVRTSSDGVWQGENPLNYAFPLLILQTTIVLFTSRFLAVLLKPLRQPKVVAEIVGGILLGPSALGRNKDFLHLVFPAWSTPILESAASIGLLFFLFLVGLELDLTVIRQSGRKAFSIAIAGMSVPFIFGAALSLLLHKAVNGEERVSIGQYILFLGVALSITAFPVLARILAELKLLTTQVGQTAMAAAAFNDLAAWILLALAVALASNGSSEAHKNPLISVWVLISGVAFVAFMLILVRPLMNWLARQCSPEHDFAIDEAYICLTLSGVMLSGFITDLIGIHAIFGAFIFGLTIPKGEFAAKLIKRIEDFVAGLLLPLYFASSGLKTDVTKIRGVEAWGLLALVITTACAGKILGTFVAAMLCMVPARESLALGLLMNTKGLVELIVLNIGREKKVLNDEMFAILVLMALFTTFMTTPAVMAIYKPLPRMTSQTQRRLERAMPPAENAEDELRILACIHGPGNVPSLINLIESIRTTKKSQLKLYVMHLVELTDRSSSIVMVQQAQMNGFPFVNRFRRGKSYDQIAATFGAYGQLGRICIRHLTAISTLSTMHEDICHVAEDRRVAMIILPFHKLWRGVEEETMENFGNGWRGVNQRVLKTAPCSVAVLVDRGYGRESEQVAESANVVPKRVGILFIGGPDDREALELGGMMAEHQPVQVTLVRFLQNDDNKTDKELDEYAVAEFIRRWEGSIKYEEKAVTDIAEAALAIGQSREYELLVVGKGQLPSSTELADNYIEHAELGHVGDVLASDGGMLPSTLVIQQQNAVVAEDVTDVKMI
ncbi:Monovalent cation:proton antiporter, putative [Theobroma cacao]|uniref:Monovalent cation:proton antiporter, putative n=1 Tax=Theobroma cacao TaxID=3641 RepID=A0A061EZ79_THECC|nr:Monovalent cation:proton antiporter, putative [Theobroma cacao]